MSQNNTGEKPEMRFSDEKLFEFHSEFREHVTEYKERQQRQDACIQQLIIAQQKNTEAIAELIDETRDIVRLHRDLQGVTRVGVGLKKFMTWLAGFGFVGVSLAAVIGWVIHYFDKIGGP